MPMDEGNRTYIWERGLAMNKKLPLLIILVLLVILAGCGIKVVAHITSPIDSYAVFMSSVPGYPLEVELDISGDKPDKITIKIETDNGSFLEWGIDMKVRNIGKAIEYTDSTVYWSPFDEETGIARTAKIIVTTSYMRTIGKVTSTSIRNIYSDKDGIYTFKKSN